MGVHSMEQQRAEVRISTLEKVKATILGHPDVTVSCNVSNISKSGLCIHVNDPIAVGRAVKVEWSDHFLIGRVARSSTDGKDFRVGLELLYCSQWHEPIASVLAAL